LSSSKKENLEVLTELWENYSNRKFADKFIRCAICRIECINITAGFCSECVDEFAEDYLEEAEK
jgi:hypothetical protein